MSQPPSIAVAACTQEMPCELRETVELRQRARDFLAAAGLSEAEASGWELALAEALTNAVKYCRPEARHLPIRLDLCVSQAWTEARVTDHTAGLDWPEPAELPPDDTESGRGIFLIQHLTDESRYLSGRTENCLLLRKRRLTPAAQPPASKPDPNQELREARQTLDLMTEELASAYESLSAIFQFIAELEAGVSWKEFIPRWLNQLLTVVDADWFVLRLADVTGRELRVAATSAAQVPPPISCSPASPPDSVEVRAALERRDVWFDPASPVLPREPLAALAERGCGFAHPLLAGDTLVGVLTLGRRETARPFQAGQVNVIHTFGDFLGLQIRGSQMQEEQVCARLNARDLEIAANLQQALLPTQLPRTPCATLAHFYRSAHQIGGDYYDVLPAADGSVLLTVADVMGKGLPAALFAFMFRSLVRARPDLASRPGEFLAWLNQNLFQELERAEMFITAQLAYLDNPRGELRVASAGHPPLLVAGADGEVAEVAAGGPPLGIAAGAAFQEAHCCWPAARALMFTDGLIEARNSGGELLGLDAVKSALSAAARSREPSRATRQRFARLLETFEQGRLPADDTAFIVVAGNEDV